MSSIGRNDPCPCGSGKKYKHCCLLVGGIAGGAAPRLGLGVRDAARKERLWEADVVPIPARLEDTPAARPGLLLVTAGGFVVGSDVLERPSPEPDEMARDLFRGLERVRSSLEASPEEVVVRFADLVEPLSALLPGSGVSVTHRSSLPGLDEAAASFDRQLGGSGDRLRVSSPDLWAGWGLSEEWIRETFEAAAELYRQQPWDYLTDRDLLDVSVPEVGEWTVSVMGAGKETWGVSFYEREEDLLALDLLAGDVPERQEGRTLTLLYVRHDEISPAMRREIRKAGWEVAGPTAYPRVLTIGTPAGGLTRADARVIAEGIAAIARFTRELGEDLEMPEERVVWSDETTGISIVLDPFEGGDWEARVLWSGPERLSPGDARGPGADPEAVLATFGDGGVELERLRELSAKEREVVERFGAWLAGRFAESTVEKHTANAEELVYFVTEDRGVPVRAIHESDLREFVHDWYPRETALPKHFVKSLPVSLERFFDFLAREEGIECPWAEDVLGERDAIARRLEERPESGWWDPEVADRRGILWGDLEARVMSPATELGESEEWGVTMGLEESRLQRELERRWLLWRDEAIRSGEDEPEAVRAICARRQHEWECRPHERLGGRTPLEVILEEREERGGR
jgi:hypothetical protein